MICPVVLGTGRRFFNEENSTKTLKLVESKTFDTGMVLLSYQPDKK
jgi:dihydrofolate reductase